MDEPILGTRREFLQKGLGLVSAGVVAPVWLDSTAFALDNPLDVKRVKDRPGVPTERILVVLQLSGGNDVLATIVPHGMDDYYNLRAATAVRPNEVIKINRQIGFNPRMASLKKIYDAGKMAVVQAVSYPNPNRSHFHSMDIWHSANRENPKGDTGWLARAIEAKKARGEFNGTECICIGSQAPRALIGRRFSPVSFQNPYSFSWQGNSSPEARRAYESLNKETKSGNTELDFMSSVAMDANAASARVIAAVRAFRPKGRYQGALGNDLRTVAAMIAAGLPTRFYYVSTGGFDTHGNQRPVHDRLWDNVSQNVTAFLTDLEATGHDKRVVVMSFSEFGRRVTENASGGTDHGAAGAMFLYGTPVKGGIYGEHPSLTELDRGDLQWKIDFRSVYSTLIENWMGGDARTVLGKAYPKLKLV